MKKIAYLYLMLMICIVSMNSCKKENIQPTTQNSIESKKTLRLAGRGYVLLACQLDGKWGKKCEPAASKGCKAESGCAPTSVVVDANTPLEVAVTKEAERMLQRGEIYPAYLEEAKNVLRQIYILNS